MPPRKSAASTAAAPTSPIANGDADVSMMSTASAAAEPKSPTTKKSGSKQQDDSSVGIEDLTLQRAAISRLARGVLPPNTSLQKDAIHAIAKSATVFISYLASHANEQRPSAKTITPGDVLNALRQIELAGVMEVGKTDEEGKVLGRLEREMGVYEEVVKGKRKGYRDKVKARESGVTVGAEDGEGDGERGEPDAKRVRRGSGDEEAVEVQGGEGREDEDALLDAQLNGTGMDVGDETEEVEEVEDEADEEEEGPEEGDEDEDEEAADEEEEDTIDRIDVEDEPAPGRRVSSRSTKGRHSLLSPNGKLDLDSDDSD